MQLIVKDDRKYWDRTKKSKQLSLIIILLNIANTVVTGIKECQQSVIFCIFNIDQLINDHEWTTNNALLSPRQRSCDGI